ncbi:MAG: hypothetical protein IPK25_09470 [Saprospiraceae bacterium]|nr:hypothetical protein [Saprospiraceae bacterium]
MVLTILIPQTIHWQKDYSLTTDAYSWGTVTCKTVSLNGKQGSAQLHCYVSVDWLV